MINEHNMPKLEMLKTLLFSISSPLEYKAILTEYSNTAGCGGSEADRVETLAESARIVYHKFGMFKTLHTLSEEGRLTLNPGELTWLETLGILDEAVE